MPYFSFVAIVTRVVMLPVVCCAIRNSSLKKKAVTKLSQTDFNEGTYRIKEPGLYVITEDIEFGPQASNDYWPPFSLWGTYPPTSYYLGFFAAITVEADNVEINLGGHRIRQSEEFYLRQRFFNVIELNDRVFVDNEGVSSLNYQKTDSLAGGPPAGSIIAPKNVFIRNGHLGRSSHAGIHGNGVQGLVVTEVVISDFEVAGIHCNGCSNAFIQNCEVGPSAKEVPALATFSNARFLDFYTHRLIPHGFSNERNSETLQGLFGEAITFADRPGKSVSLQSVFDRLRNAIQLFQDYKVGKDINADHQLLLEEAKGVFANPSGLTDGGVQYGIFFNKRGMPEQDDNFNGAGKEAAGIIIKQVKIHGLYANPIEVPSLMTEEGTHMQGPARDLLRIFDITTDRMRTLLDSQYKGNFLSDVYFAMWQLSNSFYRERVFHSDCGNFGSNASMPFNLKGFPSELDPTCADLGELSDPSLRGRDVTMLQKRYFGGLQLSQGVYDWATTPLSDLGAILGTSPRADFVRNGGRHKIVCDHDTMFHVNHGVVGLKLAQVAHAVIEDVEISDLRNSADQQLWVCGNKWQLQPSGEDIMAVTAAINSDQGSMVRGVEIVLSDDIRFNDVKVTSLTSEEGGAVAFDIKGDGNDRSDHTDDAGVTFRKVVVDHLSGPRGTDAYRSAATPLEAPSGIEFGLPEESDASLGNPRMILNYQMANAAHTPRLEGQELPVLTFTNEQVLIDILKTTTFDTYDKLKAYRRRVLAFYTEHYGMRFYNDVHNISNEEILNPINVLDRDGNPTTSVIQLGQLSHDTEYHATSMCITDGDGQKGSCSDAAVSLVHDFAFNFFPGDEGYTFYGAFGGDHGKFCPKNHIVWVGVYSFERVVFPGTNEGTNLQVEYYGECPTPVEKIYGNMVGFYINCAVESDQFGKGMATGAYIFYPSADGTRWILNGYPSMIFDDQVQNPVPSTKSTTLFDSEIPRVATASNKWRFSFLADGTFPTLLSGVEAVPLGHAHHYTHEAGIEYLKFHTSLKTDNDILALRFEFLEFLHDYYGINIDPAAYDDIPLDGVIDLGGGNHILAYVVNEDANQRVMTKRGHDGAKVVPLPRASRLHEGGFRLVAGRAGIMTADGRIPFGTTIVQGIFLLEDATAKDFEISFKSASPLKLNPWATTVDYRYLKNEELGDGKLYSTSPFPKTMGDGIMISLRGVMVFGNLGELWQGLDNNIVE